MVLLINWEPLWSRRRMVQQILVILLLLQLLLHVLLLLLIQGGLALIELLSVISPEGNGVLLRKAVVCFDIVWSNAAPMLRKASCLKGSTLA